MKTKGEIKPIAKLRSKKTLHNVMSYHTTSDVVGKVAKITEILGIEGNLETPQEDNSFNFLEY